MLRRPPLSALALLATVTLALSACAASESEEPQVQAGSTSSAVPVTTDVLPSETPSDVPSATPVGSSSPSTSTKAGGASKPSTTPSQPPPAASKEYLCNSLYSAKIQLNAAGLRAVALVTKPDQAAQIRSEITAALGEVASAYRNVEKLATDNQLKSAARTYANAAAAASAAMASSTDIDSAFAALDLADPTVQHGSLEAAHNYITSYCGW
jgi:hypothetical protein